MVLPSVSPNGELFPFIPSGPWPAFHFCQECSLELLTPQREALSCRTSPEKPQAQGTTNWTENILWFGAWAYELCQNLSFKNPLVRVELIMRQGGGTNSSNLSPKSDSIFGAAWLWVPQPGSELIWWFYGEEWDLTNWQKEASSPPLFSASSPIQHHPHLHISF